MRNLLILADTDDRAETILRACHGWNEEDVLLETGGVDDAFRMGGRIAAGYDLIILDHSDPVEFRLHTIVELTAMLERAKFIVTNIPDAGSSGRIELIFKYLDEGASGYVVEGALDEEIVLAIKRVMDGGAWIEPEVTAEVVARTVALHEMLASLRPFSVGSGQPELLTNRQQEVFELLADGLTNREIADALFISIGTVKNHVHRILTVLQASSREQAAHYYQYLQTPTAAA